MSDAWKVAVLGGGEWGTALAVTSRRAGHAVKIWARDPELVANLRRGENPRYLPGIPLGEGFDATTDIAEALAGADCVLSVIPAQSLRPVLELARGKIAAGTPFVICAKGIERSTGKLLSAIVEDILPEVVIGDLSGPGFATDVAKGYPVAVAVAARDATLAAQLAIRFSTPKFRCYSTDDLAGVEIGGALKNVFAIAAGAIHGAGLGVSAQAAMVTRGFVELRRFAAAFGAQPETVMGLSGLGDLILTCGSPQSRNFSYGAALGRGESTDGMLLAEGVPTALIARQIAADRGIDLPIMSAIADIVEGSVTVREAVEALMTRPLRAENDETF